MKHVLITGAAGLIGTGLREQFAGRHRLRLYTPQPSRSDHLHSGTIVFSRRNSSASSTIRSS